MQRPPGGWVRTKKATFVAFCRRQVTGKGLLGGTNPRKRAGWGGHPIEELVPVYLLSIRSRSLVRSRSGWVALNVRDNSNPNHLLSRGCARHSKNVQTICWPVGGYDSCTNFKAKLLGAVYELIKRRRIVPNKMRRTTTDPV